MLTDKKGNVDKDAVKEVQKYQEPNKNTNINILYEKNYLAAQKVNFKEIKNSFGFGPK